MLNETVELISSNVQSWSVLMVFIVGITGVILQLIKGIFLEVKGYYNRAVGEKEYIRKELYIPLLGYLKQYDFLIEILNECSEFTLKNTNDYAEPYFTAHCELRKSYKEIETLLTKPIYVSDKELNFLVEKFFWHIKKVNLYYAINYQGNDLGEGSDRRGYERKELKKLEETLNKKMKVNWFI